MGQQRFDDIVERNQRALRPRNSILSIAFGEIRDAFDASIPVAERRPKQIALAIIATVIIGAVATFLLWPRDGAPGGAVRSRTGATVELDSLYEHERVVAVFYPGRGCDCDWFLEDLEKHRAQFKGKVIAVSSHTVERAADLHDRLKLGFEIYVDPKLDVIPEWKVPFLMANTTTFAIFVIEAGGKISFKKIGQPFPSFDELVTQIK